MTATERRIVELVSDGLNNAEIAERLSTAESTVRWHLKNVFRKLGVASRTQLAVRWLRRRETPSTVGQERAGAWAKKDGE